MRVPVAEAGEEHLAPVREAVPVRVPQPQDVRRRGHDHPVLVQHQAGHQVEPAREDRRAVHAPVPVVVVQDRDLVVGGNAGGLFLVGVARGLGDPHAAALVPVEGDRVDHQGLGGHKGQLEVLVHEVGLVGPLRGQGAAGGVAQARQLIGGVEQVHLAPSGPGDAAQEQGAEGGVREGRVVVALQGHEGPVGALVDHPHLGRDGEDVVEGAREDARLLVHVHLVVDLVLEIEVRDAAGDGVGLVVEVEADLALEPLRDAVLPGAAGPLLEPAGLLAADGVVHHHQAAAALEEGLEVAPLLAADRARLGGVHDQHVGARQLVLGGKAQGPLDLSAALLEQLRPLRQEARVVVLSRTVGLLAGAQEDAQGLRLLGRGRGGQEREQEERGRGGGREGGDHGAHPTRGRAHSSLVLGSRAWRSARASGGRKRAVWMPATSLKGTRQAGCADCAQCRRVEL